MADRIECIVIGAGVVGLSVARELAQAGRDTLVVEAQDAIGTGTSSRNSEVIHAGIYYPKGSNKARLCVDGKHRLYEFCESHGVEYRRCGKLIVASDYSQLTALRALEATAVANGVHDLRWLTSSQARELEPALHCVAALLSPSTGIVDSHGFMLALQGDVERAGATVALHAPVRGGRCLGNAVHLDVGSGEQAMELEASIVVNCAGLHAQAVARRLEGLPEKHVPTEYFAKGSYYTLQGKAPFRHLVYPVPEPGGLGVHLTLDLAGQARFGPDVEWVGEPDFTVDPSRANGFYEAIRQYWPQLPNGALYPGYAGIRPKLTPRGAPAGDFVIQGPQVHGVRGLINLYGIESPGLTAALAIAAEVVALCTGIG